MFGLIRVALGFLVFFCLFFVIRRGKAEKKTRRYLFSAVVSLLLTLLSFLFPFENAFVTFASPSDAYRYMNSSDREVRLVVNGKECDLVVGQKGDADVYHIFPKTAEGSKLATGFDTQTDTVKIVKGAQICVYRYKDTDDYFVTVLDTEGGAADISDVQGSVFLPLERENAVLDKTFVTYYASVTRPSSDYWLCINGEIVFLFNE